MNLVTIAWKSIRQRSLASFLTALSVALGITLMVAVLVINSVVERVFNQSSTGYDLVVGVKGSPLQLVMKAIFHVGGGMENIPYTYYRDKLLKNPKIKTAIPIALGDTTQEGSFPIIGTTPEFFAVPYLPDRDLKIRGDILRKPFDAVVGYAVYRQIGWDIGKKFQPVHGVGPEAHVHDDNFTVVGVMAPTGTPIDQSVFINLEGFFMIGGHEKPADEAAKKAADFAEAAGLKPSAAAPAAEKKPDAHDHHDHHHHHNIPDEQKELTAVLLKTQAITLNPIVIREINQEPYAQAANPAEQIGWLKRQVVGNVRTLMLVMTFLIIIVSGVGIFVSIYNSMSDRRKEIAIMRALGAQRGTVFSIILLEAILLCLGGGILGICLGHGLVFLSAPMVEAQTGLILNPLAFEKWELILLPMLVVLASLIGIIPGMTAYRTDVARNLT
ncbi:MAG: ABC transporter permease [Planctomycetales bacterium]